MITINGETLTSTCFPDKTTQVWKLPPSLLLEDSVEITWTFSQEGEFLELAQLKDLLDVHGVQATLVLPYLPYGRQDKKIANDTTFALHTFSKLLNGLCFDRVLIHDPHSDIATSLIERSSAIFPKAQIYEFFAQNHDLVCYPDAGAAVKYGKIYRDLPAVVGNKVRDQASGRIKFYALEGETTGQNVLIIDDICDGGMTFIKLAQALKDKGAAKISLFVSHGIFSQGTQALLAAGIKEIRTPLGPVGL